MAHKFTQRVYYSDTDAGGIVYHARYLDFAEHGRTELLRLITENRSDQDEIMGAKSVAFVVKSIDVVYHSPLYLDDLLTVETSVESFKRFSLSFIQEIKREEQSIATLKVRVAAIDMKTLKVRPLESWFIEAVKQFTLQQ